MYFKRFIKIRNLKLTTIKSYEVVLKEYCKLFSKDLEEILFEDKNDLKIRLIQYRNYLIDKKLATNTIKMRMSKIKTFYKHYDIKIPQIPKIQLNEIHEGFEEMIKKEDIKTILKSLKNLKYKAIILFILSSGSSINETMNLSLESFFKGFNINCDENINVLIKKVEETDKIPIIQRIREKNKLPLLYLLFN